MAVHIHRSQRSAVRVPKRAVDHGVGAVGNEGALARLMRIEVTDQVDNTKI